MQPKYIHNYQMSKNEYLTFHNLINDEMGNFWVYSNRFAACFRINALTFTSEFIGWNDKTDSIGYRADTIGIYKGHLVSTTRDSQYLEVINTKNKEKKYVRLEYEGEAKVDGYINFIESENLYLVSRENNDIHVFPLSKILESNFLKGRKIIRKKNLDNEVVTKCICFDGYIVFFMKDKSYLGIMNTATYAYKTHICSSIGREITDIVMKQNKIYVLYCEGHIGVYDMLTRVQSDCFFNSEKHDEYKYNKCFIVDNYIWVFPATKNDIFVVDIVSGNREIYNSFPMDYQYQFPSFHSKFASFFEDQSYIFVGQRSANYMMLIDKKTGKVRWVQVKYPQSFLAKVLPERVISEVICKNKIITEGQISLDYFLKQMEQGINRIKKKDIVNFGEKIYKLLIN